MSLKDTIRLRLANNLDPFNYHQPIKRFYKAVVKNEKDPGRVRSELSATPGGGNPARYALFSKALGINTSVPFEDYFIESEYRPSQESNDKNKYYRYSLASDPSFSLHSTEEWKARHSYDMFRSELGTYTIGKGSDDKGNYYSIYDLWDINPLGQNIKDITGITIPFELYDRIYENEPLYKIILNDYLKQSKRGKYTESGNVVIGNNLGKRKQGGKMNYLDFFKKGGGIHIKKKL